MDRMGGKVAGDKIRYAAESTEYTNYLAIADEQVKTAVASYNGQTQRVGVVMLAFSEMRGDTPAGEIIPKHLQRPLVG